MLVLTVRLVKTGPFIGKRWVGTRHWGSRGFDQVVIADLDLSQAKNYHSFHMGKDCVQIMKRSVLDREWEQVLYLHAGAEMWSR